MKLRPSLRFGEMTAMTPRTSPAAEVRITICERSRRKASAWAEKGAFNATSSGLRWRFSAAT